MEKEEKLTAIAGNLDKTQVVSLKDLEELEYLQLVGKDKKDNIQTAGRSRTTVPLSAALGLLAAVLLAAVLAFALAHHLAYPAAAPSAAPQGSR